MELTKNFRFYGRHVNKCVKNPLTSRNFGILNYEKSHGCFNKIQKRKSPKEFIIGVHLTFKTVKFPNIVGSKKIYKKICKKNLGPKYLGYTNIKEKW